MQRQSIAGPSRPVAGSSSSQNLPKSFPIQGTPATSGASTSGASTLGSPGCDESVDTEQHSSFFGDAIYDKEEEFYYNESTDPEEEQSYSDGAAYTGQPQTASEPVSGMSTPTPPAPSQLPTSGILAANDFWCISKGSDDRWHCPVEECLKDEIHYSSQNDLRNHISAKHLRHTRQIPCPVEECAKQDTTFSRRHDLARHMRLVHTDDAQVYDCSYPGCQRRGERGFPTDELLKAHIRSLHRDKLPTWGLEVRSV